MSKMNDLEKVTILVDLLVASGNQTVQVAELETKTGSARRARRAVFVARKGGMILEPVRNGGRDVTAYVRTNPEIGVIEIEAALAAKRKPRKIPSVAPQPTTQEN